jgi:DnaK suppressor protein
MERKQKLDAKKIKNALLKQKEELEKELKSQKSPISEHENSSFADSSDLATHDTDLSNDLSVKQIKLRQYQNIIDALERVDEEDFGSCEDCGVEIGAKRLEVYPATRLCVACQEEQEKKLKAKHLIDNIASPSKKAHK